MKNHELNKPLLKKIGLGFAVWIIGAFVVGFTAGVDASRIWVNAAFAWVPIWMIFGKTRNPDGKDLGDVLLIWFLALIFLACFVESFNLYGIPFSVYSIVILIIAFLLNLCQCDSDRITEHR